MRFDVLAAANPEISPTRIRAGMKIRVPGHLMKTREPMPQDFVDRFYARPPREKVAPAAADKDEEPPLIGPRDSTPK
jgi:hypothetical protein